ncbi:MAG TPA: hydrogen gas-evolving membrane-bound hydrogenase subunit E [Bacillota bacterium]|nr:hydrogen gas-evolving membrane-bound hydrogenase subunit E [Bacillota bacterium]
MLLAILLPIIFAIFVPFITKYKHKFHPGIVIFFIPFSIFIYFLTFFGRDFTNQQYTFKWIPSLHINFDLFLDGLSLLFVLLISGIGTLVVLYSVYYLDITERLTHFYIYLLLFMSAMLGVVLSDNIFVLYTFWELTSISSFLLIGYWHFKERSRYGALKSLLITVFGGLSMLGGLIFLSIIAETTSFQTMMERSDIILSNDYALLILILIFIGAFTKSAQFPFHIWLPDAMEAPTPVSAYLHSATMVKAGLYLIARTSPIFSNSDWFFIIVTIVGITTLVWGSYMAVRQTDLKAILAFSTISQLGMIMAMLGFGTEIAIFAAIFHIINHATFKGGLFMVAGIVDVQTGTRDIRKLGSLMSFMPIAATLAMLGTFSMAGIPLPFLNGFYSKELFFDASLSLPSFNGVSSFLTSVIPYLAVIGSIFTFVYSMYLLFGVFSNRKEHQLAHDPKEAKLGMLIPPIILTIGVVLIGLFPNWINDRLITFAATSVSGVENYETIKFWHGFSTPFVMSLIVVGLGALLYATKPKWEQMYDVLPGKASFNRVYDWFVERLYDYPVKINQTHMTGSVRNYMAIILGTLSIITFAFMFMTGGFTFSTEDLAEITILEISIIIIIITAAIGTLFMNHKVSAILVLGIVGYGVAMLFVLYRAPDLALTQLVIETATVVLFLLAFYHLPKLEKRIEKPSTKAVNLFISISFGALMAAIGISAHSTDWFDKISDYFLETSLTIAGGHNVVNVILVDMRGIDTLFEITVLGIAGLAVFSLIRLRKNKEAK